MKNKIIIIFFTFVIGCGVINIFAARYYRLLEHERKIFLGLRGIDSLAAETYVNLESPTERSKFYEKLWVDKPEEEKERFEERVEYAFNTFGRYAPLSDDRIPVYVKYGEPSKREQIIPQKKVAVKIKEVVKPAEIWTYKKEGLIFDFVRFTRAYILIAHTKIGDSVMIPHLADVDIDTVMSVDAASLLDFTINFGRFRQKKNLTRLEIYLTVELDDTTDVLLKRKVEVYNESDSLMQTKNDVLQPENGADGIFHDEVDFWLPPAEYRCEIEIIDGKHGKIGKKTIWANLLDYQDDAKEISDLIPAILIDQAFTHQKFNKPVGRVIPLTQASVPMYKPFYFYAEVYNLETKNGMHQLKMTYEVYNKEKMRREIVDVMIKDQIEAGNVAYLGAQYHPMDLQPGNYLIVLKTQDLLSNKERTAVGEFELYRSDE
jgi:hypothetical protein